MKKILITGGAGFIGFHLATLLLQQNLAEKLILVDDFSRGKPDADFIALLRDKRITLLDLDLTDQRSYSKLGNSYDHVYHLAAINGTKNFYEMPHEVLRINTLTLLYMLEWFKSNSKNGKFCFTSSNEAYACGMNAFNQLPIPTPENVPLVIDDTYNPRWSYAGSKLIGELFVIHYAQQYRLRALIVRPHNFYGPRAGYDHVIPQFSLRIARKVDPFPIFGVDDTRTFCYIDDAVKAMHMLMDSPKTDILPIETVHIGASDEISILELAKKMFAIAGWKPNSIRPEASPAGSVKRRLADVRKIKELINWQTTTPLEVGLKATYEWYLHNPQQQ